MSPGRAEAHAEDARSALTRRSARSYLRPDIAPSHRACAVDSRESTSVPSHLSSAAPLLSAEPTGLKPTHTCFRRADYRRDVDHAATVGRPMWPSPRNRRSSMRCPTGWCGVYRDNVPASPRQAMPDPAPPRLAMPRQAATSSTARRRAQTATRSSVHFLDVEPPVVADLLWPPVAEPDAATARIREDEAPADEPCPCWHRRGHLPGARVAVAGSQGASDGQADRERTVGVVGPDHRRGHDGATVRLPYPPSTNGNRRSTLRKTPTVLVAVELELRVGERAPSGQRSRTRGLLGRGRSPAHGLREPGAGCCLAGRGSPPAGEAVFVGAADSERTQEPNRSGSRSSDRDPDAVRWPRVVTLLHDRAMEESN